MGLEILIIGGARSGKSHFAQELARKQAKPVLFVATATASDEEMKQRIEEHKKARPVEWRTLETSFGLAHNILQNIGSIRVVVIDCITLLVNNIFGIHNYRVDEQSDISLIESLLTTEIKELIDCINQKNATFIIVTNEVGLGLVPDNKVGRIYRDLLGKANQMLAERSDKIYMMVAGIPVLIKPTTESGAT